MVIIVGRRIMVEDGHGINIIKDDVQWHVCSGLLREVPCSWIVVRESIGHREVIIDLRSCSII